MESPYHAGDRYIADLDLAERQRRLDAEREARDVARRRAWEARQGTIGPDVTTDTPTPTETPA